MGNIERVAAIAQLAVIVAVVVGVAKWIDCDDGDSAPETADEPVLAAPPKQPWPELRDGAPRPTPRPPTVTVMANDLERAYRSNAIAAEQVYGGGRLVTVAGRVEQVTRDLFGDPYVLLEGDVFGVRCFLADGQADKVTKLDKGDAVSLVGTMTDAALGFTTLRGCMIDDVADARAPEMRRDFARTLRISVGGKGASADATGELAEVFRLRVVRCRPAGFRWLDRYSKILWALGFRRVQCVDPERSFERAL